MHMSAFRSKDFWAGVVFLAGAAGFGIVAPTYGLGSAARMGAGYFPAVVAGGLAMIGIASIARSLVVPGEPVGGFATKAMLLVLGSAVLFGVLARGAGLAVSIPVLLVVSASASRRFRWRTTILLAILSTLVSILVFVKVLGLPFPIFGRWLAG